MEDQLFGFKELEGLGDAQFWLDHERSIFVTHLFLINADNAIRRRTGHLEGYLHLIERVKIPVTSIRDETLYEKEHDVWGTGSELVCGQHGENCPACDVARHWIKTGTSQWVCYPRMTPDGRLFLAGVCNVPGDELFNLRLQ